MALTSTTKGFWPRKNLIDEGEPQILEYVIKNSTTVTLGDAVKLTNGYAEPVTAGDKVMGVVTGIVDVNGLPINHPNVRVNGTITGDDTYAAASNNTTVDLAKVQIIVSKTVLFYNNGVSNLTAAANGLFVDTTANGDQITGTGGSTGQFQIISVDPDGDGTVTKALVRIAESQLDAYAQA